MMRAIVAIGVLMLAAAPAPLDLAALLDRYAAGRFDEAVAAVAAAGDEEATRLRQQWRTAGQLWIGSDPATARQRALAAAVFLLETEHLRAERGEWRKPRRGVCPPRPQGRGKPPKDVEGPPGECLLTWSYERLVERGEPDEAERGWLLAASSLVGGVRAWPFLYHLGPARPVRERSASRVMEPLGLIAHGLRRFPDDPELRLERALALASRFNLTIDGGGLSPGAAAIVSLPSLRNRADSRESLVAELTALGNDAKVGAEARLRLGYLHWATGHRELVRPHLEAAASATNDPDLRYLAHFLLGWTALADAKSASDFERALTARPNSQSAVLALAAIELQRGDAARAYELAQASLTARPADADPWRLFLYGHYPQFAARVAELRRQVRP